ANGLSIMAAQQVNQALACFKSNSLRDRKYREQEGETQQYRPQQRIVVNGPADYGREHQRGINIERAGNNARQKMPERSAAISRIRSLPAHHQPDKVVTACGCSFRGSLGAHVAGPFRSVVRARAAAAWSN